MFSHTVKCETCGREHDQVFRSVGLDRTAGVSADCFVREGRVLVRHDFQGTFELVGDARAHAKTGPICDGCLTVLQAAGQAVKIDGSEYLGLGAD